MFALLFSQLAHAGSVDAMVAVDGLYADSTNPGPGAGPEKLSAFELGTRVRANLRELDDRLRVHVDFRGRFGIAGELQNNTTPLLYRAEARYAVIEDTLVVGAGRFVAPTPTFLPLDGANATYTKGGFRAGVFGGRRAISTSRATLPYSTNLLGVGGFAGVTKERWGVDGTLAWSQDLVRVPSNDASQEAEVGGLSAVLRANGRPTDAVVLGGQVAALQQATYVLGPTWTEATVEAQALDLFNALAYVSVRPKDWVRMDLDGIHQNVAVWAAGTLEGGETVADLQEPRFTDARLRLKVGPPKIGWLRPMVRYRVRPDRTELRMGARLDVNQLGVPGLFLTGQAAFDDISGENQKQDVGPRDRTFGSGAIGFRKFGLDGRIGASYVERAASPVSGRRVDPANPGLPNTSDDLQPFTLEADPILFARAFWSGKRFFAGGDFERHPTEPEMRFLLQVGVLTEVGW